MRFRPGGHSLRSARQSQIVAHSSGSLVAPHAYIWRKVAPCAYHREIGLQRRTRGVLGYGSYAGKKDEVHAAWRSNMAELATCPNVSVKLGGMLNRGAALNFRELPAPPNSAAWRPYVEPCIELFGAERCNFESNFPVDKMGTGYATLWNAFKRITAGCSRTEKLALYSGTAKRLYHLD